MNILTLLKWIDAPGSLPVLVACVTMGLVFIYIWPRKRWLGLAWLWSIALVYAALAMPVIASHIADSLPAFTVGTQPSGPIETLVVLDGDNREGRIKTAREVFSLTAPKTIWLVGNLWMLDPLQRAGIPWDRLKPDEDARTTRAQLDHVRTLAARGDSGRIGLVASRLQMPRIAGLLNARATSVVLIPSPIDAEPPTAGFWRFVPNYGSLCASRDALYEHAALAYYRWQGWIP